MPDKGIYFYTLSNPQQQLLKELIGEYFNNFNAGEMPSINHFCNDRLRFFYMDSREKGKPHYYRLENGKEIIEYENYGNHIHCFWRTSNDFGKEMIK